MKISILTTITNPDERQDKWKEAIECYCDFADQVVVVNGSNTNDDTFNFLRKQPKVLQVFLPWPYEWNWLELPKHLNRGLEHCTGDWVLKLDIDQFIHENDFKELRATLRGIPPDFDAATLQKMSMTYGKKYFQKGPVQIAFRKNPNIKIGKDTAKHTDLCFPIRVTGYEDHPISDSEDYRLPTGFGLKSYKTGIKYWNYDYFFKTKDFTEKEFWRFARAYQRYYDEWKFGRNIGESFTMFMEMMRGRHNRCPYTYELKDHPQYIRDAVEAITPKMFGHNAWELLNENS